LPRLLYRKPFYGVKQPELETDHTQPSNVELYPNSVIYLRHGAQLSAGTYLPDLKLLKIKSGTKCIQKKEEWRRIVEEVKNF
jgi:hypothetical protein